MTDRRFNAVLTEELARAGASGPAFGLHNDIIGPYLTDLTNDEQKQRWLPGFCSGEIITAIAMTEPGAGSDLQGITTTAVRDGDDYVLNGQKTFISNGILADLVIVVARTDPRRGHRGISLLVVERGMAGFERGRNLDKIGQKAQDTAELFFADVRVPAANLLGEEGEGFALPDAQPALRAAVDRRGGARRRRGGLRADPRLLQAAPGVRPPHRHASSTTASCWPSSPPNCASAASSSTSAWSSRHLTAETAAMAKWWCTELQQRTVDRCLQLHGGYGYMREYPVAEGVPGRPRADDLRRHHGDHEGGDRPVTGPVNCASAGRGFRITAPTTDLAPLSPSRSHSSAVASTVTDEPVVVLRTCSREGMRLRSSAT